MKKVATTRTDDYQGTLHQLVEELSEAEADDALRTTADRAYWYAATTATIA